MHLLGGSITGVRAQRTRLEDLLVDSVTFTDCDLSHLRWTGGRVSRAVFTGCKLTGAAFEDSTWDNVVMEKCRLDFATFTRVRATGPVVFSKCSLVEAEFTSVDLTDAVLDDCDLTKTEFSGGQYRGLDLRGNDLSKLRGVGVLKRIIIDPPQTPQLGQALATVLDVTYGQDVDRA